MAPECTSLSLCLLASLVAAIGPAYMQQAAGQFAPTSSMTESILSGMERGTNSLKRTLAELNATANEAVSLAEEKVHTEYIPGLSNSWRWAVLYAQWLNPEVVAPQCPEDPLVARLLREAEQEALGCVRDKVPRGIPDVHNSVNQALAEIDTFMQRARKQGEECDEEAGLQGVLCKATRLAPMGGHIGVLGGGVGRVGGEIGVLVDGHARHCTITAAQTRETAALSASHNTSECIKAAGTNAGNYELARIFANQRRGVSFSVGNGGAVIINGVRQP